MSSFASAPLRIGACWAATSPHDVATSVKATSRSESPRVIGSSLLEYRGRHSLSPNGVGPLSEGASTCQESSPVRSRVTRGESRGRAAKGSRPRTPSAHAESHERVPRSLAHGHFLTNFPERLVRDG